jgi:NAD(P)-dependent dehydrogenase (short-subunit alcohol dehydrogenase family)
MPYSLKGRNVLVTGGSRYIHSLTSSVNRLIKANRGLDALLCERFFAEDYNIVVNYVSSESAAKELAKKVEKEYSIKSCIIQGVRDLAMKPMVFYSCVPSRTLDLQQIMLDWLRKPLRSSVAWTSS